MTQASTNRVGELVRGLLDRGYEDATGATLRALSSSVSSGVVAQRLRELEAEAARLQADGQRMTPDNAVLRALVADLEPVLKRNANRLDVGATDAQDAGVAAAQSLTRELALFDVTGAARNAIVARWNVPDPEAVNALVGYVNSEGWADEIARYPSLVLETVQNQAIRGIVEGWNPTRTAREIRRMTQGVTVAQANTLMRTVQLQSYRRATAAHQLANRDILQEQIRIATLDARTCLACVALHGTRYPIGVAIPDHHNGRCTSISVIKGVNRNVPTGEDWLNGLDESQQRAVMGNANYLAWRAGDARLRDFVREYRDDTFGRMVNQASLKSILGDDARSFYSVSNRAARQQVAEVPTAQLRTLNGMMDRDVGAPGNTVESLTNFLNTSNGPLAQAMRNSEPNLFELNWGTDQYEVNRENVRTAAKAFVSESRDIRLGKEYILSLVAERAQENGITVDAAGAAQLMNDDYAYNARAILEAARLGSVKLTEAQQRRLNTASSGDYLEMVYTTISSERGSVVNRLRGSRAPNYGSSGGGGGSGGLDWAAEDRRREWIEYFSGR